MVEPDFTILQKDGQTLYWEHLGMLGRESYDKRWLEKTTYMINTSKVN